jgi:hypothetical protein
MSQVDTSLIKPHKLLNLNSLTLTPNTMMSIKWSKSIPAGTVLDKPLILLSITLLMLSGIMKKNSTLISYSTKIEK